MPARLAARRPSLRGPESGPEIHLGWPGVIDVGGIDGARWLEALVPLWVRVAEAAGGDWQHGLKLAV